MDAKEVIDKIIDDANKQKNEIEQQGNSEMEKLKNDLQNELSEYNKETQKLAKKAADDKKAHMLAASRMNIAREILGGKRKILDSVFEKAKQQLAQMPDNDYLDMIKKLMLNAVETGDEEVVVDQNEKRINQDFIKDINRQLGPGFKGNLRLSETTEKIDGGFILKRGDIQNNASFEVLIGTAKLKLETELAKELFS